jgi:hypothetical protein
MTVDDKTVGTSKGTMIVTLEKPPAKK